MKYRADIDGLRAVAVMSVLLFHLGSGLVPGGFTGVDIFLVISGFVIALGMEGDLAAGRFSIATFYGKRICRILPALSATLLLTTAGAMLLLPDDLDSYFRSVASVGAFLSNFFFWKESGYFETAAQTKPLLHSWSLALEEQFYLLMPLCLAAIHRFGKGRWRRYLAPLWLASFGLAVAAVFVAPTAGYFLLPTRAWELLTGSLLATGRWPLPRSGQARATMSLLGIVLIGGGLFLLDGNSPFPGWNALLPCIGTALIVHAGTGAARLPAVNALLSMRPLRGIGLISYSLYLVHWPISAGFHYALLRPPGMVECLAMLLLSILLATLSWHIIEQPARSWGQRQLKTARGRKRVLVIGAAASFSIIGLGLAGAATHGLLGRFPDFHKAAIAGREEWGEKSCFNEEPASTLSWNPGRCTRIAGGSGRQDRILLWGDSFAAHYIPGLIHEARRLDGEVLQYSFAGCPPILAYYSSARIGCSRSNARVPELVRRYHIRHVVLAARWDEVPLHRLERLGETIAVLRRAGARVTVIGQSPQFPADVQTLDYLSRQGGTGGQAFWPTAVNPRIAATLRAQSAQARFIDPLPYLCPQGRCAYRQGRAWFYIDADHFSKAGSIRAVRAYFPFLRPSFPAAAP